MSIESPPSEVIAHGATIEVPEPPIDKRSTADASQWALIRRRFAHHKLAVWSMYVLIVFYAVALFVEVIAPQDPNKRDVHFSYCPPQVIRWSPWAGLHVPAMQRQVDPITLRVTYARLKDVPVRLGLWVPGDAYKLWGLIPMNHHLLGVVPSQKFAGHLSASFFPLGADKYGRDLFSRIVYGARVSLSVGLIGVAVTFLLGMTIGGISGYIGGRTDLVVQRGIEIINSFPQLPLWIALGRILPAEWSPLRVYFAITVLLSLLGWTGLARVVRGKILSLREEDYALAARLLGANHGRVLFKHLLPGFASHVIVALSLAVPGMILGETSLSFLGLGLRPPVVSWGVMLQDCMDVQAIRYYPWLLAPVFPIIFTVLAFNFVGDGMRDASDPYSRPISHVYDPTSPVLSVRDLRVTFDTHEETVEAVRGVDFDLARGKTLALVGESGSGKSVTSYAILRLTQKPGRISGGQILFNPRDKPPVDIAALSENDERLFDIRGGGIAMIFQEPMTALSPVHTVANQITEAIHLHRNLHGDAANELAAEMLVKVGIDDPYRRLKQYPFEFSGGMRQRVVIAMALVCRPEIMIADEPTTALDVTVQAQILKLIKDLQAETGASVLFITHDLGVVAQVADDVAVMRKGLIVERGSVRDIFNEPIHPYTRQLLAAVPHPEFDERRRQLAGPSPLVSRLPRGYGFAEPARANGQRLMHKLDGGREILLWPEGAPR